MYLDSEIAVTVDRTDKTAVAYRPTGDYILTVRDRCNNRQLVVEIPDTHIEALEGQLQAARQRRLMDVAI